MEPGWKNQWLVAAIITDHCSTVRDSSFNPKLDLVLTDLQHGRGSLLKQAYGHARVPLLLCELRKNVRDTSTQPKRIVRLDIQVARDHIRHTKPNTADIRSQPIRILSDARGRRLAVDLNHPICVSLGQPDPLEVGEQLTLAALRMPRFPDLVNLVLPQTGYLREAPGKLIEYTEGIGPELGDDSLGHLRAHSRQDTASQVALHSLGGLR